MSKERHDEICRLELEAIKEIDSLRTQLKSVEADAAVMRKTLREAGDVMTKASNMHDMVKCSNFIDKFVLSFAIDKAIDVNAGKSLLERLKEAECLLQRARPDYHPDVNRLEYAAWLSRRDAFLNPKPQDVK